MKTNPIPYVVTDLPIPYRVRVLTASPEMRSFVVPKLGIPMMVTREKLPQFQLAESC